jgi:transposase InsO family protein
MAIRKLKKDRKDKKNKANSEHYLYPFHLPPSKKPKKVHYSAEIIVELVDSKGDIVPIRALVDTGASHTIILCDFVKEGSYGQYKSKPLTWNTMGGNFVTRRKAQLHFKLPELDYNKAITWSAHVDATNGSSKSSYDMILGLDLLTEIGLYVNTSDKTINWGTSSVPLKERGTLTNKDELHAIYHMSKEPPSLMEAETRQKRILDADYSKVDMQGYVAELEHLSTSEQKLLLEVLQSHDTLFGGGLGELKIKPIHLEVDPNAKPYHARAFPVPHAYEANTHKEINRFVDIGVMEKNSDSKWAAPSFIQKKKTGDIRVLTDFRRLNAVLKRKPFPLPKISDLLYKLEGFKYATAIDLSMGYYHIPLDEESQALCTTILPWGKYRYLRLPMGVASAPDIFQSIMDSLLCDLPFCRVYIDDVLILSNGTFEDHMAKLEIVLKRIEDIGFRANVRKCYFAKDELDYLGYKLTRKGIQPQPKKVEAICRIKAPQNRRQLRRFLGMVNYYRDMWRRRSHLTAPLSALASKSTPWKWGQVEQEAFEAIKKVISKEAMLTFPDFSKPFHVYTDSSDYQLGAVIVQEGKPLAFYSRKMNSAQKNYPTGEQELLSIVETLKEFRNILLGQKIIVHTDHKNIVYGNLSNDRIVRWRLLLEEYGPEYVHIAGKDNIVADALSRLDLEDGSEPVSQNSMGQLQAYFMCMMKQDESIEMPDASDHIGMAECFASDNEVDIEKFPMNPKLIAKEQTKDKELQQRLRRTKAIFGSTTIEGVKLITEQSLIVVPKILQGRIIAWYHEYLAHPGMTRLEATIRSLFTWTNIRAQVKSHVESCAKCQLCKQRNQSYGHLPPKKAEKSEPWNRVDVDLIGPFSVKTPKGIKKLRALTMIDPATGWFEIKALDDPKAATVMAAMDDTWLSRYPRPQCIGYDNGSEFKSVFNAMVHNYGMRKATSTAYNPQSHGMIERVHQVVEDALRTFELEEVDLDENNPWEPFLVAAAFAIRSTFHTTLGATPAQLVYGRDMILPVRFQADWTAIQQRRQKEINRNNIRENSKRIPHHYKIGDLVVKKRPGILPKLGRKRDGPYEVIAVYNNGTVRIQLGPVNERLNIRRLDPFHQN